MEFAGKKYRIKSSFRFTIFVALVIIAFVIISNSLLGLSDVSGLTENEYLEVTIESGDTLWNIADKYMPDGNDLRKCVHVLCQVNSITADSIYPGQIILVPIS